MQVDSEVVGKRRMCQLQIKLEEHLASQSQNIFWLIRVRIIFANQSLNTFCLIRVTILFG